MRATARELNRATLDRQLLLSRRPLSVEEAVRRAVALQAQEPASPYLALWNRVAGFDAAALDAAFAGRSIVKATLMRITLHAAHADDYRAYREAVEPTIRGARLRDDRFTVTGLTLDDADGLIPRLLDHAVTGRTSAEMQAWLTTRLGAPPHKGVWWALRNYAPLLHAPTGGAWSFGRDTSFRAPHTLPVLADADASARALEALVPRYLRGFGPASVPDMAQFALVQRARVKEAVLALGDALERLEGPAGEVLYDVPGRGLPDGDVPAPPRLLGMWDNVLLAYHDRSRVIPAAYRKVVTRVNGDVLPTLLVDGQVAGVWRAVEGGIEATAFHVLGEETWEGLAAEARALVAFLDGRDPVVYSRYGHWWAKGLPGVETRVLPGE